MTDGLITYQELSQELRDRLDNSNEINTTLSQDYKSIFSSGTGKDDANTEQDFSGITKGQSNVKLEGFTANNLVQNGDFSNGTNLWGTNFGTITVSNNILSNKASGAEFYSAIHASGSLNHIVGHNYYFRATIRVTNTYCQSITGFVGTNKTLVQSPVQNIWYTVSNIFGASSTAINPVHLYQNYVDNVTAKDKVMEVKEVMCIDLTNLGLDSLTKEQCDYMFDHYINGLQGVGNHYLVSTGINLFDNYKNPSGQGGNTIVEKLGNGIKLTNGTSVGSANVFYRIKLEPNTQYTIKANSTTSGVGGGGIVVYDDYISKDLGWHYSTLNPSFTFTTLSDGIVRIYFYCTASTPEINTVTFTNIQLYKGSSNISYEPFKGSALYIALQNMQLHRLANGIADTIEKGDGRYYLVKRIKSYSLQSADITTWNTSYTNMNAIKIQLPADCSNVGLVSEKGKLLIENIPIGNGSDSTSSINTWYVDDSVSRTIWIYVAKNKYVDLASAKSGLTGTKLIYQLAQPIMYSNGKDGFSCTGNIEVFPNGTIYQSQLSTKQSTNAKTYITYNLSDKSLIMSNSGGITGIQKFLSGKVLLESGSNENGWYIKFDDGTMICYAIDTITYAINVSSGNLFVSGGAGWTFPSTFSYNPSVIYNITADYTGIWTGHISSISKAHASMSVASAVSRESSSITRYMMAIGRWI